jgi:cell cycle checkpoint control protein RAD9A
MLLHFDDHWRLPRRILDSEPELRLHAQCISSTPRLNHEKTLSSQSQRKPLRPENNQPVVFQPELDEDSLFMPAGDDERTWDPPNFDQDEEEEEMLGWDASNELRGSELQPTFRDSSRAAPSAKQAQPEPPSQSEEGLAPTQRLSQV